MSDPFVAEIRIFPFNFAPSGWAFCNGQLLPISQNTALFSLLGTTYGGDGKSTFALPDLRGSAPMHPGQGQGLSPRNLGDAGGTDTVTLLESELPVHNHTFSGANPADFADLPNPAPDRVIGKSQNALAYQTNTTQNLVTTAPQALSPSGGSLPHNNMMPYLTLNFCIALQGIFPSRPLARTGWTRRR
jgi:microcystin-dependent protein